MNILTKKKIHSDSYKVLIAFLFTILLALSSKISVPFYPVPMTMQTFVVLLLGISLGWKLGLFTVSLYLIQGIAGLPVFAGTPEKGVGIIYFTGPTMGYLIGFLVAVYLAGIFKYTDSPERWLQFDEDVNVVRGPLPGDTNNTIYWSGQTFPKMGRSTDVISGSVYPNAGFRLGLTVNDTLQGSQDLFNYAAIKDQPIGGALLKTTEGGRTMRLNPTFMDDAQLTIATEILMMGLLA